MQYTIRHTTTYRYSQPVILQPHIVRLIPRSDSWQTLKTHALEITPDPFGQSSITDMDGNTLVRLWFKSDRPVEQLIITVTSTVETHQENPFHYLLENWAMRLPIEYPASLLNQLQPYLGGQMVRYGSSVIDPIAVQLAQEIYADVDGEPTRFLTTLNQRIYETCGYELRETGEPLLPGTTWTRRSGSCRDFAVLFVEVCRAIGLAARFVSGYQEGDLDSTDRHLHAWAEVYLPGAGWRGYDPTQGLAVADRHIALVASPLSSDAAPISGVFKGVAGNAQSEMSYELAIDRGDE